MEKQILAHELAENWDVELVKPRFPVTVAPEYKVKERRGLTLDLNAEYIMTTIPSRDNFSCAYGITFNLTLFPVMFM